MTKAQKISIVIPCYNEEANLKKGVLDQVANFLAKQSFVWEVLICNDQSTDHSLKFCQNFVKNHPGFRVLDLPHGGKPSAVWGGIKAARYPLVLFTDMDQSTPLKEINKLLPYFHQGFDVVIGSRGTTRHGFSLIRKIMSRGFLYVRKMLLLSKIDDTQCGFKAFKTTVARDLFPNLQFFKQKTATGWRVSAFDVELLFMAELWSYKTKEVEVSWKDEDVSTTKGDNAARFKKESQQMAQEIIRVKLNHLKGFYHREPKK
ncbi:glycosyltransferase [Patescibacteria group bacterium]|nr:glycosyltransferase [Patescibacteria group bacterium]